MRAAAYDDDVPVEEQDTEPVTDDLITLLEELEDHFPAEDVE